MRVAVEVTPDDYAAFSKHTVRKLMGTKSGNAFPIYVWILIAIVAGAAWLFVKPLLKPDTRVFLFGTWVGAFLVAQATLIILRRKIRHLRPSDGGFILGPQEFEFEAYGIRQRSHSHEASFKWSLVSTIDVREAHVFVMLDRVAGLIFPRRDFASSDQLELFICEIEKFAGKKRTQ